MQEEYRTVTRAATHETEVNRSRFLCALAPAATESDALEFLRGVRAEHPAANHHCFAYVIGADAAVQRAGDDGEPSGTAGVPMLRMLLRRDVRYTVAVVTRYFGGVKLGAGGLARAYGGAVGAALDTLGTELRHRHRLATVTVGHDAAGRLIGALHAAGRTVLDVRYGEAAAIDLVLPEAELPSFRSWLADATAGAAVLTLGAETYAPA